MKLTSLYLALLLITGTVAIVNTQNIKNLSLKQISNITGEDRKRYSIVRNAFMELGMEFEYTNVTANRIEVAKTLYEVTQNYVKVSRIMSETCIYNKVINDQLANLPRINKLGQNSEGFELVIKNRTDLLGTILSGTQNSTSWALEYMDQIQNRLEKLNGTLIDFEKDFKKLGVDEKKKLDSMIQKKKPYMVECSFEIFVCLWSNSDVRAAAAESIAKLEKMRKRTEKFLEDSKNYIQLLRKTASDLKKMADVELEMIYGLMESTKKTMPLLNKFGNLEKEDKEKIMSYSNEMCTVAQEVCDKCLYFVNREV